MVQEQNESEEKLSNSQTLYKDIVELGNIGIAVDDTDGKLLYFNKQFSDLFGYSRDEIKKQSHKTLVHPDDFQKVSDIHRERMQGENVPLNYEFKGLKKDGSIIYIHMSVSSVIKKDGRIIGSRSYLSNITERKKMEVEIEKTKKFLDNIINNIADPVFVKDEQSRFLLVNDAFCDIFTLSRDEIYGTTLAENLPDEEMEIFLKIDKQVLKDGIENINEENLTVRNGKTKFISTKKTRFIDPSGKKYLIGIIRDVTEKRQATEALRESEERYRNLVETASDAIYLMSEGGMIIDANNSACNLLGKSKNEIVGSLINTVDPNYPLDDFLEFWKKYPFNKQVIFETTHLRKDGTFIPIEICGQKYKLNDKVFYYGIARDITERKNKEETMKQKTKELQDYYDLMIGREFKMIELKKEVNELLKAQGKEKKYET